MGQFHDLTQEFLDTIPVKWLDVAYAQQAPQQVLDIYLPGVPEEGPYPVVVHTHGGGFANGHQREDHTLPMLDGLKRGYAVVSIQYRRSREALFPAQVLDAKAAIRFLRAHAGQYGLDPEHVAVWGASSGGWLASMTALTEGNPAFEDFSQGNAEYSSGVQAVIDWCGPCGGFAEMDVDFRKSGAGTPDHSAADSPESRFMGMALDKAPELLRMADPRTYVHKDMPPVYIIHGGIDQVVPVEQSIRFAQAIRDGAGEEKVTLHIVEGKLHHGDPWYNEPWVAAECYDFLDKVFGRA